MAGFNDSRVFVVPPSDSRLGLVWHRKGGYEQACNGPIYVVIGDETPDNKCAALASRFGLPTAELIAFREHQRNHGSMPRTRFSFPT